MNKKSFSIYLNKSKSFNIAPFSLKKVFGITLNKSSAFSTIINGFNLIEKYILRLDNKVSLTIISKAIIKLNAGLTSGKHNFLFNSIREQLHGTSGLSNKLNLSLIPKEQLKSTGILLYASHLLAILKERIEILLVLSNSRINFVVTPELRVYLYLSDHSAKLLNVMATQTLAELSYTIV